MKKSIMIFFIAASIFSAVSAYNPPVGAEKLFDYSSPNSLSGNRTVSGGALFSSGADSLVVNPALAAGEQRVNLNAGYTFLHNYGVEDVKIGSAFQTAILIPFKLFVFSGYLNGTFIPFEEMEVGNSMTLNAGLSKEITDRLDVGVSADFGFAWNKGLSWALGANLGFNYNYGDLWIFKDFRYGASILNLGKNYKLSNSSGVNADKTSDHFPSVLTIKAGAAGTAFENDFMKLGVALDLTTSCFLNLIVDMNAQAVFNNLFKGIDLFVGLGESININESVHSRWSAIPSINVGLKFVFDVENSDYLDRNGWSESEMTVTTAYRNLYYSVNAYSGGLDLDLGMEDTTPPDIKFLDENGREEVYDEEEFDE